MVGIDGDIDDMSRFHQFSESRTLLQDAVGRQGSHVSRIRNHDFQPRIIEDVGGIINILVSDVRHTDGLTMMGIDIDAKLNTDTEQHEHQNHGAEISPKILTLKLIYKLR